MILTWPLCVLTPVEIGVELIYASRSPGEPWAGRRQIISPLVSEWRLAMTLNLGTELRVRAFRALKAALKGRFTAINVPLFDPFRVRFEDAGWAAPTPPGISFSDGAFFSDGSGWAYPDVATTVAVAAEEGSEEITLEVASIGDALGVGHFLSIDDFLYVVRFGGYGERVDQNRTFGIAPELRADVAAGAVVRIGRPQMRARLAEDASGTAALRFGKFGQPVVEFVEVGERP